MAIRRPALLLCLLWLPCLQTGAAFAPAPRATEPACRKSGVTSTPMEAALDELRRRFPSEIVIGFEEFFDEPRPECEPKIDLGPPGTTLQQGLQRVRKADPRYRVELNGRLVHVFPARGTADPPGLLDLRLSEFFLPPDSCVPQQFLYMDSTAASLSYTPDLSKYLDRQKDAWYARHRKARPGSVGSFMGDCAPREHRRPPIYHDITVREALNLMALRSLQIVRGEVPPEPASYALKKPVSWKYRFRRDPEAETGLGGVPVFQTF